MTETLKLPVLPLTDSVLLPGMVVPVRLDEPEIQAAVDAASSVDRGAASAVYFSLYYGFGAVGGYVPGLAWQEWHWDGVVGVSLAAAIFVLLLWVVVASGIGAWRTATRDA